MTVEPKPKRGATRKQANERRLAYARKDVEDLKYRNNLKNYTPGQMIDLYNKHNQKVDSALNELKSMITSVRQGDVNKIALEKARRTYPDVKTIKDLRAELAKHYDVSSIPNPVLSDLIALDDWSTIWNVAKPLFIKYGVPIIRDLWNTHIAPRVNSFVRDNLGIGGDQGLNSADWAGNMTNPYRYTFIPGVNVNQPGIESAASYLGQHDLVSTDSIRMIFCPELYKNRYTFTETQRTALAVPSLEYTIITNASGNVGVSLLPRQVCQVGDAFSSSYLTVYNGSDFSLSTGTQTAAATFNAGPLYAASASVDAYRVVGYAATFLPTASLNTAGAFTFGYNNRSTAAIGASSIGATLATLKNWPYVTSFNNKTSARFTFVYGDSADDSFNSFSVSGGYKQYMVLLGSGLPASTEVGRFQIQTIVEFTPLAAAMQICPMAYPQTGPLTEQFEALIYQRFPILQMLDLPEAKRIAEGIPDSPVCYKELFDIITPLVTGIQPREYVPHSTASNIIPNDSADFLIE